MRNHIRKIVALLAVASVGPLAAQSVPPPRATTPAEEDAVLQLSPFEVATSKDTGYQATETLAGTRIKTNLADVASPIQVITKEFLQDLGAVDNQSLLMFTTSTEVAGTQSVFAGVTPSAG